MTTYAPGKNDLSGPMVGQGLRLGSRLRFVAAFLLVVSVALHPSSAFAGTGLRTAFWSGSNYSIGLNSSSNVVGYWRLILRSMNNCPGTINGTFNTSLQSATITVQQTWNTFNPSFDVTPADGVINPSDWDGFEFSKIPPLQGETNPPLRYQYFGTTDGFGTQYWTYYGGGNQAHLGWNPYAQQNYFDPYFVSHLNWTSGWSLLAASASNTMGSYSCNA